MLLDFVRGFVFLMPMKFVSLLFLIFFSKNVIGQAFDFESEDVRLNVIAALGSSLSDELAFNFTAEVGDGQRILQLRYAGNHEGLKMFAASPQESSTDISFLYGTELPIKELEGSKSTFLIAAGVGYTVIVTKGDFLTDGGDHIFGNDNYEKIEKVTVGLPFEFSFNNYSDKIGFRAAFIGNLNEFESYVGLIGGFSVRLFK